MDKKVFIKRLIIWGSLFLISLLCFAIGITKYYNGYGKHGSIRIELKPIIDTFNELDNIKNNKFLIDASYENDTIQIKYVSNVVNLIYNYTYKEENNNKYIELEYSNSESEIVEEISKELIESISIINGNKYNDIFNTYEYSDFYFTSIEDEGIHLEKKDNLETLTIKINNNLYEKLNKNLEINKSKENITSYDLKNIKSNLINKGNYTLTKNSYYIYVESTDKEYVIYVTDKNNNKEQINNLIYSIIQIIDNETYQVMKLNNEEFNTNKSYGSYEILLKPKLPKNITISNQEFIKIILKK